MAVTPEAERQCETATWWACDSLYSTLCCQIIHCLDPATASQTDHILSYKPNFIAAPKSDLIQFTSITETRLEKATSGSGNDLVIESESLRLLGRLLEFFLHAHGQKPTRTLPILSIQRPGYAP